MARQYPGRLNSLQGSDSSARLPRSDPRHQRCGGRGTGANTPCPGELGESRCRWGPVNFPLGRDSLLPALGLFLLSQWVLTECLDLQAPPKGMLVFLECKMVTYLTTRVFPLGDTEGQRPVAYLRGHLWEALGEWSVLLIRAQADKTPERPLP